MLQKSTESRSKSFRDKSKLFQGAGLSWPSEVTKSMIVSGALEYLATKALYGFGRLSSDKKTFSNGEMSLSMQKHTHITVISNNYMGTMVFQ